MRPSGRRPRRSSGRTTGRRPAGHLRHRRHRRRRPAYRVGLPSVRASTARWRPSGTAPCPASPSRMCSWTPPTARPGSTAAWSPRQWWWPPGVCGDGRREVLGFAVGDSEDGAFWTQFLRSLKARGLAGVQVIADASTCAKPSAPSWPARRYSAAGSTPPQRPAPSAQGVGRDGRDRHPHDFAQPDAAHVHEQLDVIAGCWAGSSASWRRCCATPLGSCWPSPPSRSATGRRSGRPTRWSGSARQPLTPRRGTSTAALFERAQLLLAERSDSARAQAANATGCLLADLRPPAH
jgi:hypothetical protein